MKKILIIVFGILFFNSSAQDIQMDFPHFKGKAYDFIIFQGTDSKTIIQGTIPEDGKFTLHIPEKYAPYTGMSRWLITGTEQGGGLDMLIPGHNFSVSCKETKPNDKNIIYKGNEEILELNALYKKQQDIFAKHDAMLQATKAFPVEDTNYTLFKKELQSQINGYDAFQIALKSKDNYPAKFINIVNMTQGIGTHIAAKEEEKAKNIADYMARELDWNVLYTSGHWEGIIASWVGIHTQVFNEPKRFSSDFAQISMKIKKPQKYKDFIKRVGYLLSQSGKDDFISAIVPIVTGSGKIKSYDGTLGVYMSGTEGTVSSDLVFTDDGNVVLKSKDFSGKNYQKTLLVFYKSDCGNCEILLKDLQKNYEKLSSKSIRVISMSADSDMKTWSYYL